MKERSINIVSSKLKIDRLYFKNQPRLHIIAKEHSDFDPNYRHFSSSVKVVQAKGQQQKESTHNLPKVTFKLQESQLKRNNVRVKTSYIPSAQKSNDKERKSKRTGTIYVSKSKEESSKKKLERKAEDKLEDFFSKQIQKLIEKKLIHRDKQNFIIPSHKLLSILGYLIDLLTLQNLTKTNKLRPISHQHPQYLPKLNLKQTSIAQLHPNSQRISEITIKPSDLFEQQISDRIISMKIKEVDLIEDDLSRKEEYLEELNRVIARQERMRQQISRQLMNILNGQQLVKSFKHKIEYLSEKDALSYEQKCREYKDAQKYMADYAAYLDNNELAISLDFDENLLKDQRLKIVSRMSQIIDVLDRTKDQSYNALKTKLFLQDLDSFHLDKERQILKVCHLKTHSIKCFIRNTRHWFKNWKFKQDLLNHLKQLFAINSHKMSCLFEELKLTIDKNQQTAAFRELIDKMHHVFKEIVEYFTLGNSFY